MRQRRAALAFSAVFLAALAPLPLVAAEARATGNLSIHAGPASWTAIIGTLPDGVSVALSRCTREARWCRIRSDEFPDGWVRGSYLVGAAAKARATPPEFVDPPGWPF